MCERSNYKTSFTAALVLLILFGVVLLCIGIYHFTKGSRAGTDAPDGYRSQT